MIEISIYLVLVAYMGKLEGILEDVIVGAFYIFLGLGIVVSAPLLIVAWISGGMYTPSNDVDSFFSLPYLWALGITWGSVGLLFPAYYFLHVKALSSRILNTLKFYGSMRINNLATRYSTTEASIQSAITKLKSRRKPVQYDQEKKELIYSPLKKFVGIIDVKYQPDGHIEDCILFFTSTSVIVAIITRDKLDRLKQISGGEILRADERNFSIPRSDVLKVEMTEWPRAGTQMDIVTEEKTYTFTFRDPSILGHHHITGKKLYEAILRSILPDKLSIQ